MSTTSSFSKKELSYIVLFTVFLLAYMIVLAVTDKIVQVNEVSFSTLLMHYLPGLTRILGFLSFRLSRRLIRKPKGRKLTLVAIALIFLASAVIPITVSAAIPVLISVFTLSFSLGHLGGLVYYCVSVAFSADRRKGRFIGIACSASILFQFFLSGSFSVSAQLITAAILFIFISYLIIKSPSDYILEDPLPYTGESREFAHNVRLQLTGIIVIVFICMLLACRTDIEFVSMSFDGSLNIYSYPRLVMIAGYLLMGFCADLTSPKTCNSVFFSGVLLSAVLVLMPISGGSYTFFLGLYYFFISLYIFFYTYSFISVAPRTGAPELWASMGRPLSDFLVSTISLIMLRIGSERLDSSPIGYGVYYLILLIALYLIMTFIKLNPNLTDNHASRAVDSPRSAADWLDGFPLTPRERDVACMLIETDAPIKAVAASLRISERSVYRYSASIYEKTGTDNRTGLIKAYMSR
ncbi:MAG: helix-turn-helix transcriptional regulator [Lachnospiraceae bacterium]|nr:helix-turn-helix transcriptional regulator [Lachnospiraceae bacterium]